jgi:hypothetical protein
MLEFIIVWEALFSRFVAAVDPGVYACHRSIRDTDIELIEKGRMPPGAYTPRGVWFIQAADQVRSGAFNEWAIKSTAHFSDCEVRRIARMGKVELDFERRRREIAPEAASRLSNLYIADDNEYGREHLKRMLGMDIHILRVTIPLSIRVSRCDTAWFDAYWKKDDENYIDCYWSGVSKDPGNPTWEYLLDGMIEVNDPAGMEFLIRHGTNIAPRRA